MLNRADELVYNARKLGGNRVLDKLPDSNPDTSLMDFLVQNRKV